ncbi:MAG TPA: hypothetical protein VGP13_02305 [Candidatus Paceibacterota bacterium]|jgi:hypothetical protein|nr:hypothetical protein [Candidatus Paceibacterota bacterium]
MLKTQIIKTLAAHPSLGGQDIQKKVAQMSGERYSIQGVYKDLRKLQKEGVIFKLRKKYSLRLPWVLEYIEQADAMADTYLERPSLPTLFPSKGQKTIWHFTDLLKMNDFWSHLLLLLLQQSKDKTLLGYNPHPWFHLVQTKQEEQYIHALRRTSSKLRLIVGGNTYLDKWTEKFLDKRVVSHSFAKSSFHTERAIYFNVIDDYVITVKLDPHIAQEIDRIYADTKSMDDLDLLSVLRLFRQKTKVRMWLEQNPAKAKGFRTKFKKFWGTDF